MASNGVKVVLGTTTIELMPSLQGRTPRGWSGDATWEHTEGLYAWDAKEAIVTEFFRDSNGDLVPTNRAPGVLRHEVGHAISYALEAGGFHESGEFKDAHAKDKEHLDGFVPELKQVLDYFLQPDSKTGSEVGGRSETFAEIFAIMHGGGWCLL